jgi:hypothetical protein
MTLTDIRDLADQLDHDSWAPINLNALPDKPPIEPTLGGTSLLYPGKRHVFSGPPESAKTLAAYTMLILVARTGHTGILIDFEMGSRDAKKRLQELGATPDEIDLIPYLEPDIPATPARLKVLVDLQPQLVVIDAAAGAYQAEGLDDNKRADVERFSRLYVGAFWLAGIATIIIDHVVKNIEGRGKFAIGSERKLGSSDVHLGFDTIQPISRGTSGRYKITTHKDRGGCLKRGHIADLELESDPDTNAISWRCVEPKPTTSEGGYFRPTHLMEKVSINLETRTEPASRNEIAGELGGTKEYVLKAITALVTEDFVTETPGPRRSKLLTSKSRYREADDTPPDPISSVVRQWFGSGSANQSIGSGSGGSVDGSSSLEEEPPIPPQTTPYQDHPKRTTQPVGWFGENGNLADAWYDQIKPDEEDA